MVLPRGPGTEIVTPGEGGLPPPPAYLAWVVVETRNSDRGTIKIHGDFAKMLALVLKMLVPPFLRPVFLAALASTKQPARMSANVEGSGTVTAMVSASGCANTK